MMMRIVQRWLLPSPLNNNEGALRAHILHYILLFLFLAPPLHIVFTRFQKLPNLNAALTLAVSSEIINIGLFLLARKGYIRVVSIFLVGVLWLYTALAAYLDLGQYDVIFALGNATIIILAGILLGGKGSLVIALLSIFAGSLLISTNGNFNFHDWIIASIFFLTIFGLQLLSSKTARCALDRTHASRDQYRSLLENLPVTAYISEIENSGALTYVSPQVADLFGYTRDEFLNDSHLWKKILHPDDRKRILDQNNVSDATQGAREREYKLIAKNNQIVWVNDQAALIKSEDGVPLYWLGVWTDITGLKQAALEQENSIVAATSRAVQLQTAAEVARISSSMLDPEELLTTAVTLICEHFNYYYVGIFLLDNENSHIILKAGTGQAGEQMIKEKYQLEAVSSSMIGWSVVHQKARIALNVGADAVHFKNPLLPLTRSEIALPLISRGETLGAMTIQSEFPSAFSDADVIALQTMADQIANAINAAQLLSERSDLIDELERRNAELERFAYTVSHDLKSPLVTIRGYTSFLQEDVNKNDMPRFTKDLSRIASAADTMQNLLNDLLELSRIGRVTHPFEDIPFNQIIHDTLELLAGSFDQTNISVVVQDNLPIIHGDRIRLLEVTQNLLSNAIKFMGDQPAPRIEIGCDERIEDGLATFFIRDNGVGIDPQYHEKIFGLFNRLAPEIEGTGVGLPLVRRIVEVHGGQVWLDSSLGRGSVFFFSLPVAISNNAEMQTKE